jgi:hypothetical protein
MKKAKMIDTAEIREDSLALLAFPLRAVKILH